MDNKNIIPGGRDSSINTSELLNPIFKKYESKKPFLKKSCGIMLVQTERTMIILILFLNMFMQLQKKQPFKFHTFVKNRYFF